MMSIGGSTNTAYFINAYLGNSGYSFVGGSGGTLTNMLKNSAIKKTSSIIDGYNKGNSTSSSSGSYVYSDEKSVADSASALRNSAAAIAGGDLFKKDAEGNYDKEKIAKGVSQFVDDYNRTIKSFANSENVTALQAGVSMTQTTSGFKNALNRAGITVNKDNTLTLNTDKLKNTDPEMVKNLLDGRYSYSSKIAEKAKTAADAAGAAYASTYNKQGNVNTYSNSVLASILSLYA